MGRIARHAVRRAFAAVVLSVFLVGSILAGPTEDEPAADLPGVSAMALRPLADKGDAEAQYKLGVMYEKGRGVAQDYAEAHKWFNLAAAQGNKDAEKSRDHITELMTPEQIREAQQLAREWMSKNSESMRLNYSEELERYRKDADQDDREAQNELGVMYSDGQSLPQDYAEAVKWFRKSAENDYAIAQYNLGLMYNNGHGVEQDYAEAVKWYRKSADQGYADAQYALGLIYERGQPGESMSLWLRLLRFPRQLVWSLPPAWSSWLVLSTLMYKKDRTVPQDYVEAHKWLNLAAAQGNKDAEKERNQIARFMTPDQIAKAQRLAREWKPRSGL
jgi:TPR repeat protein